MNRWRMKNGWFRSCMVLAVVSMVAGCGSTRTGGTASGGVLLSVTDFDGLPVAVSVNSAVATGVFPNIGTLNIQSILRNPSARTSDLMNVELQSFEIVYTRIDSGSRVPTTLVRSIFGVVPVAGSFTVNNLPIATSEQLTNAPLSDLLFENGGFDRETGSEVITMNLRLRFFGRTISGEAIETEPVNFSIEFQR